MKYGFTNNFSQVLASALTVDSTMLELDAGKEALGLSDYDGIALTLADDEGNIEIVLAERHYEEEPTQQVTIQRAQEGTTAKAWQAGAKVEARLTAGGLGSFFNAGADPLAIGANAEVVFEGVAVGESAYAIDGGVTIGDESEARGGVSIGNRATSKEGAIALGEGAIAQMRETMVITALPALKSENPAELDPIPPLQNSVGLPFVLGVDLDLGGLNENYLRAPSAPDLQGGGTIYSMLYIDSVEWIPIDIKNAAGTPKITIREEYASGTNLLEETAITALTLKHRQELALSDYNGLKGLFLEVTQAGTGTIKGKLVFKGYSVPVVEELQWP